MAIRWLLGLRDGRTLADRGGDDDGLGYINSGLTLRRMLETAIANSAQKLGLQEEVAETSRVNADITTLLVDVVTGAGGIRLLSVRGGRSLVGLELLVGVINEILLSRHVVDHWW